MVKRDISWDEALKPDFSLMMPFFVKYLFAGAWYLSILYVYKIMTLSKCWDISALSGRRIQHAGRHGFNMCV